MYIEFCLPVKNEEIILAANAKRLEDFINQLGLTDWSIVIIVNGSDDSSSQIAASLESLSPEHFKAVTFSEGGKGYALKQYFKMSRADVLVFMDIDLAVSLNNLPNLLDPVVSGSCDLVIGSRLLPESDTSRSFWRSFSSKIYNSLSRIILDHNYSDLQCGFKVISAQAWRQLSPKIKNTAFFFDTELIYFAQRLNLRIKEIPVDWSENRYSFRRSKINFWRDPWLFLWEILKLRRRH